MSDNVSDYTSPYNFSIADNIPENMQNPLNVALGKSIFDRFLTEPETQRVIGTIGRRNTNSTTNNQIVEGDTFDQAYQLQPVVHATVGVENLYYTYKDLMGICERAGLDVDNPNTWQAAQGFNFHLPIDLDKFINYTNYFWVNADPTVLPEYVTIRNTHMVLQQQTYQMIAHYNDLYAAGDTSRLSLWATIKHNLDLITTYVDAAHTIELSGLDITLNDPIHTPYVYTVVSDDRYVLNSDWQTNNYWVHKMHVTDITNVTRATMPILEYSELLQMTGWTYTSQQWKYRRSQAGQFQSTTAAPTNEEIFNRFPIIALDADADTLTIAGDKTSLFTVGKQFAVEESDTFNGFWTPTAVTFDGTNTILAVRENVISGAVDGNVVPYTVTSQGDPWVSFYEQWAFVRNNPSMPTVPPANQITPPTFTLTAQDGQTEIDLPSQLTYVVGSDTINVYVNGVRQYGTYTELTPTSFEFLVGLNAGDVVQVALAACTAADQRRMSVLVRVYNTSTTRTLQNECLVTYRKSQQQKTDRNQYPLFDLVNFDGTPRFESSSLIQFEESSTAAIDPTFGKRIVKDAIAKDYTMNIDVIDTILKCFIVNGQVTSAWKQRTELAVPVLVDADGNPTTDNTGVWSIPEQFTYNIHHEIRPVLKFSELFGHFRSIAAAQTDVNTNLYGTLDAISSNHLIDSASYGYGVGGTIRDYNGGFDTFVSTLISSEYQYTDVIAFARDQYRELLVEYYARVENALITSLAGGYGDSDAALAAHVSQLTLSGVETDSLMYNLFGDSTIGAKYNGLKNWIATTPYFGWKQRVQPEILVDSRRDIFQVIHHDGHKVLDELDFSSFGSMLTAILTKLNLYNTTKTSVITKDLVAGQLGYDASTNTLYRLTVVAVSAGAPLLSLYDEGVYYVSTKNLHLYQKQNNAWVDVGTSLDPAWKPLDLQGTILKCILDLEQRLYDGAANVEVVANPIIELPMAPQKIQASFEAWAKRNNIDLPYQGDYVASDPFTWYYGSIATNLIHAPSADPVHWGSRAYNIYQKNFGTMYPHLQPWVLQGYATKPTWWDLEYAGTTRRWSSTMWTNILNGIVPVGYQLPNGDYSSEAHGEVKAWNFVSVNVTEKTTADGYGPDDLLPPYWVPTVSGDNVSGIADQVFLTANISQLTGISTNWYLFGEMGPYEQQWTDSVDYYYDLLIAEYFLRPMDFIQGTFGEKLTNVAGLDVCERTNRVYTHNDVVFHGDVDQNGNLVLMDGVNQWYTQYFRYLNLDTNANSYKDVWKSWETHLSYNVGAFTVDNTLSISSSQIDVASNDFSVASKVNSHVRDVWIDALYLNVAQIGSKAEMPNGSGRDWKFNVFVNCPISRAVPYFDVVKATITADATTNVFTVGGGKTITQYGWNVGQPVVFDTGFAGVLPAAIDNMTYYFLIPVTATTFQIAASKEDAAAGKVIALQTSSTGVCYVGELSTTFYALSQQNAKALWRHFKVNETVLTFTNSTQITGVQNLIDFIDGYSTYLLSIGFDFNLSSAIEYDPINNRQLNWQYEIERVIDNMYMMSNSGAISIVNAIGTLDVNPFRNHLWVNHPQGVVSSFDAQDASQTQYRAIVYDNTGNLVSTKQYNVLREDKQTQIAIVSPVAFIDQIATNDFATIQYSSNNIGGAHVFFDEYEHIVVFNDYAISGDLIWDQFLGIQVPRLSVYFEKQVGTPKRPNVGGYVLREDGTMMQNWEYTVSNINNYYDTFTVNENSDFVSYARSLLGYRANVSYLSDIGTTPKSQFLFYKGLIQNKGTRGSITAYTNAANLNAADIDEFWAYKTHEFGENRTKGSFLLNLHPDDTTRSHMKLQFVVDDEPVEQFFTPITASDSSRWLEYPNQRSAIVAHDNVSFDLKIDDVTTVTPLAATGYITGQYVKHAAADAIQLMIANTQRATFVNVQNEIITLAFNYPMGVNALLVYVNGVRVENFVELAVNRINVPGSLDGTVVVAMKRVALVEGTHYKRINNRIAQFLVDPTTFGPLNLVRYLANVERNLPISILDTKSKTTVVDMATWDPLNGTYTNEVLMNVDEFAPVDPAVYNSSSDQGENDVNKFWNAPEAGKVWMDTSTYKFVPYNDAVAQDTSTRLLNWGRMEEWSVPTAYIWTASDLAPSAQTDGTPYQEVYQRTRAQGTIVFNNNVGTVTGLTLADQDEVIFVGSTTPLTDGVIYSVSLVSGNTFTLNDQAATQITNIPNGTSVTIMKASFDNNWTKVEKVTSTLEAAEVGSATTIASGLPANVEYSMYVDGIFTQDGYINEDGTVDFEDETIAAVAANKFGAQLTLMNKTGVTDGLPTTAPDAFDLTSNTIQEYVGTPYVTVTQYDENSNVARQFYYYWVTGSSALIGTSGLTTNSIEAYVDVVTKPFVIFSDPVIRNNKYALSQLVAVGISGLVSEDGRYVLRMVRDETLRDRSYRDENGNLLKPIFTEWKMFRKNQSSNVDRRLWDLITEAMVGYKLADPTQPIPALDRVVYDKLNGTNTRFGMEPGQAISDGTQTKITIMSELNDPTVDFTPNDVDLFLATHDLTTNANIITFMDDLYGTFAPAHVNQIFFSVLLDGLANVGANYSTGIIKTSGIAVKSSMPLNVNGALDG